MEYALELLKQRVARMDNLITALLKYSRTARGLSPRELDTYKAVEIAVDLLAADLEGFDVQVTSCSKTDHVEAGTSYSIYSLSVTAERGSYGDVDYVQRSLTAKVGGI